MCSFFYKARKCIFRIEQKGMHFDHDFGYSLTLLSSLLKKRGEEMGNECAKIVIKGHAFLLDRFIDISAGFYYN